MPNKKRFNAKGNTVVSIYSMMSKMIVPIVQVFPEFKDELETSLMAPVMLEVEALNGERSKMYLPGREGSDDGIIVIDDPAKQTEMDKFVADYNNILDRMSEKYADGKYPIQNRMINITRKFIRALSDPDAMENISGFPEYYTRVSKSFLDMPSSDFKDSATGEYTVDMDRYQKFMDEHVFLDQAEETSNFYFDTYLPYNKKVMEGTVTAEDSVNYNKAYENYLLGQRKHFTAIKTYDHSDPDIAANKVCNNEAQFGYDWKGDRFANIILRDVDVSADFMSRGWPAMDLPLIKQFILMDQRLDVIINREDKHFSDAEVEEARRIKEESREAYSRLMNEDIHNPEERMSILNSFEEPVKAYAKLITDNRVAGKIEGETIGEHSLSWQYDEIKNRTVFPEEIVPSEAMREISRENKVIPGFENRLADTKKERDELFRGEDGKAVESVETLPEDKITSAAKLYDDIFGPVFEDPSMQGFKSQSFNNDIDFLRVGNSSLVDYLGADKYAEIIEKENGTDILKAEILRMATDPRIPLSISVARKDPVTEKYVLSAPHDIFDALDRERIISQKPYLKDIDTFSNWLVKEYSQVEFKNLTEEDRNELYHSQLRIAADQGLLSDEKVVKLSDIMKDKDPAIPADKGIEYVYNLYGASPKFIAELAGDENGDNKVYNVEQFKKELGDVSSGNFSNEKFALMSYIAATDPGMIDGDVYPEAGVLSKEDKVFLKSSEWTTSLKDGKLDGEKYLGTAIGPVRRKMSSLIEGYEAGMEGPLVESLGTGLKNILATIKSSDDLMDPDGSFSFNGHILKKFNDSMKENPDLYESIKTQLTEDELYLLDGTVKLIEMQDEKLHSLDAVKKAQEEGLELTAEEKAEHIEKIATYDHFATEWIDSVHAQIKHFEVDKNHQKLRGNLLSVASKEGVTEADKLAASEEENAKLQRYENEQKGPSAKLIEALNEESPVYENAAEASRQIEGIREIVGTKLANLRKAKVITDQFVQKNRSIEPDEAYEAQRLKVNSEYYVQRYITFIANRLSEDSKKNIFERFNAIAKKNGWGEEKYRDNLGANFVIGYPSDKSEAFVNVMFEELERSPHALESIGDLHEEIQRVTSPDERELTELQSYPHREEIEKLKSRTLNQKDLDMLDKVNEYLADGNRDAIEYIMSRDDVDHLTGILSDQATSHKPEFADGRFHKDGEMTDRVQPIGSFRLSFNHVKNPNHIEELKETAPVMAQQPKEEAIAIIKKMKEYGIVNKDSPIEQGGKIYAHQKLIDAREELRKAVQSGDINAIRLASNRYEKERAHMQEIFDMTSNSFGHTILTPGNVDTIRNGAVPFEFSSQLITDSRVNGLYQAACMAEKLGVTPEEFIENPGKHILNYTQKKLKENGFSAVNNKKGNTGFLASYRALYEKGMLYNSDDTNLEKEMDFNGASMLIGRTIEGFCLYDETQAGAVNYMSYDMLLSDAVQGMIDEESAYIRSIYHFQNSEVEKREELRDSLKMAFLDCGNIEKKHIPLFNYDEDGNKIQKLPYQDTLDAPDKYKAILNNYNNSLAELKDINKYNDEVEEERGEIRCTLALEAIEESMFDYLMTHPEDSMKPEYKALEKAALSAHKKLGIETPKKSPYAEKYNTWKSEFNTEYNMLYSAAKDRDKSVNKLLSRYNKQMKELASKSDERSTEKFLKASDTYRKIINNRLTEMADEYKKGKLTENYFVERTEQLLALKESFKNNIADPPKFFDETNPGRYRRDINRVRDRINNKANESHLDNLDNFKKWKMKQKGMELLQEDELTREEWEILYDAAKVDAGIADRPLPNGYKEVQGEGVVNENGVVDHNLDDFMATQANNAPRKTFEERKKALRDDLKQVDETSMGDYINNMGSKDPEAQIKVIEAEDALKRKIAEAVAAEAYERLDGKLPRGVSEETFVNRLLESQSFENVVSPMLNNLFSTTGTGEYKGPQQYKTAVNNMIKLIENKTVITCISEDQKYLDEKAANKDNPKYKPEPVSPGVRKIRSEYMKGLKGSSKTVVKKNTNVDRRNNLQS